MEYKAKATHTKLVGEDSRGGMNERCLSAVFAKLKGLGTITPVLADLQSTCRNDVWTAYISLYARRTWQREPRRYSVDI